MSATCPRCSRQVPRLQLVAVVFGSRFHSCYRRQCIDDAECHAELAREGEIAGAIGKNAIVSHRFSRIRHAWHVSAPAGATAEDGERVVDAIKRALDPWGSIREDYADMFAGMEMIAKYAAERAP